MGFCGNEVVSSLGSSRREALKTHLDDLEQLLRPVDRADGEAVQELDCGGGSM